MRLKRKIIQINEDTCNGCGQCIPACPEQAIQLVEAPDGKKARLVKELYCDGLGACLGNCPTGALTIEEREAEAYDDAATVARIQEVAPEFLETHRQHIQEHAAELTDQAKPKSAHAGFSCPSARMMQWATSPQAQSTADIPVRPVTPIQSELRQWPVQLHLVPPAAPYLKNADLVVCADCVPFAYANFHQEFLRGEHRAIVIGCPKLDDTDAYLEKFVQILAVAHPQSITIINMEVPCCFGLVRLLQSAIEISGQDVPLKTVTISIRGDKLT